MPCGLKMVFNPMWTRPLWDLKSELNHRTSGIGAYFWNIHDIPCSVKDSLIYYHIWDKRLHGFGFMWMFHFLVVESFLLINLANMGTLNTIFICFLQFSYWSKAAKSNDRNKYPENFMFEVFKSWVKPNLNWDIWKDAYRGLDKIRIWKEYRSRDRTRIQNNSNLAGLTDFFPPLKSVAVKR